MIRAKKNHIPAANLNRGFEHITDKHFFKYEEKNRHCFLNQSTKVCLILETNLFLHFCLLNLNFFYNIL